MKGIHILARMEVPSFGPWQRKLRARGQSIGFLLKYYETPRAKNQAGLKIAGKTFYVILFFIFLNHSRSTRSQSFYHQQRVYATSIGVLEASQEGTAGLPISLTWGLRHKICRRGPILIPRPVLESQDQTTRGNILVFFCKN